MKAVWVSCLIFFPFITMVVYLIARGQGMAERNMAAAQGMKAQQDAYIRTVASSGGGPRPSDEIARAKALLDCGAIAPGGVRRTQGEGAGLGLA